jgi:hypothetical protein
MLYFLQTQIQQHGNDLYTFESIATLGGAAGITFIVAGTVQHIFNFNPKWFALGVAQIIAFFIVVHGDSHQLGDYFLGLLNGFLIYSTAVSGNATLGAFQPDTQLPSGVGPGGQPQIAHAIRNVQQTGKRTFLSHWF